MRSPTKAQPNESVPAEKKPRSAHKKTHGPQARLTKRELERDLAGIYGEFDGDGALEKLEQAPKRQPHLLVIGAMAFFGAMAAAAWAGFFVFTPSQRAFAGDLVKVTVDGPVSAVSGQPTEYVFRIKNGESQPLGATHLTLRLPPEFLVSEFVPSDEDREFDFGSLAPGAELTVTVKGELVAALGRTLDLQALLSYRPASWNADFQAVTTLPVTINDSTLTATTTGPAKAASGDLVKYEAVITNTEETLLDEALVEFVPPAGFIVESATPKFVGDRYAWKIADLAAGALTKFSVTGSFVSTAKGTQETVFAVSVPGASGTVAQARSVVKTEALGTNLALALVVNSGSSLVATPGETLRLATTWKNVGGAVMEEATLKVTFDPIPGSATELVDWSKLVDKEEGVRKGNTITWTKKQLKSLEKLGPGEEGALEFSVPAGLLRDGLNIHAAYGLAITAELMPGKLDGQETKRSVKSEPVAVSYRGDTSFAAEGHYFSDEGAKVGSGPLPPKQGEATTYRMIWRTMNSAHDLEKLRATAVLPLQVEWAGVSTAEAGTVTFDAKTRTVSWELNWLPTAVTEMTATFDVRLVPSVGQVGSVPPLLGATRFTATDKAIGKDFSLMADEITTALEDDDLAQGKGKVE